MRLPFNLYSKKSYWVLKNRLRITRFNIKRHVFGIKNFLSEEKYKAKSTVTHIRRTLWNIVKSIAFIISIFTVEYFVTNYWQSHSILFPDWLLKLQRLIPKPTYPDDRDAIVELISVIASVTGVILALFYPILATIASTAYAKVHASIRNLLLYEKETQAYLRRLTYLTACSIIVLLFLSFHLLPGNLILSFLALYAITTLFGILKIGLGVYNFFEPSTLSRIVSKKLTDSINNVTTQGIYWNEVSFQKHNYKLAFEQTENLSLITSLCLKDDALKESSFKSILQEHIYLFQYYLHKKPTIPIDSLWFPNAYQHASFFESDMSKRGLSQNSKTFIQPEVKQNHFWFEERILNSISRGLKSVVESGNINVFSDSVLNLYVIFDSLSAIADLKTGGILLNNIFSNIILISEVSEKGDGVLNYEDWKDELSCIETYCYALLRFQVGIFELATKFDSTKIIGEYNKINWKKKNTIYSTDFIPDLYESLNECRHFIENEKSLEGKQITPDWYTQQFITANFLRIISEKIQSAVALFDSHLLPLVIHFDKEHNSLLSTFTAQIGLGILHKLKYRVSQLKSTLIDLDKIEVCKGEFKWVKPNFEEIEGLFELYTLRCFESITNNISKLSSLKWNNQFPDVFAHSYSLLLIHLNDSFEKNDLLEFQRSFPSFLKAAIEAFGNINKTFKHFEKPQRISYQTLIDIMEISGYGYIYSVIYKKPEFWNCIKEAWDENFLPNSSNIELFATYYNYYKRNLYGTGINFNEKHQRETTLSEVIRKLRLRPRDVDDLIVKPFIKDSFHSAYSVAEMFMEMYLFTFVEAKSSTKLFKREFFKSWVWDINNPDEKRYDDDFWDR